MYKHIFRSGDSIKRPKKSFRDIEIITQESAQGLEKSIDANLHSTVNILE